MDLNDVARLALVLLRVTLRYRMKSLEEHRVY